MANKLSLPAAMSRIFEKIVPISRGRALDAIFEERDFQDVKWGTPQHSGGHTLGEWVLLIEAELNEAKKALIKGGTGRNSIRSEITQIAAVALSALEQHGTTDTDEGRQI